MSTITSLNSISSGVTSPSDVNENFYSSENESFRHINGYLDSDNANFSLDSFQLRRQAVTGGQMRGLTGNLDYTSLIFPSDDADSEAYTPIPGASISFYLPYDASVVIFSWQLSIGSTQDFGGSEVCELKMFVDDTFQPNQFRAVPEADDSGTRRLHRDRFWNGHHTKQSMTEGWHTASIRIFQNDDMARIRVRNMKVIWFK